jgi:hypothetical protein
VGGWVDGWIDRRSLYVFRYLEDCLSPNAKIRKNSSSYFSRMLTLRLFWNDPRSYPESAVCVVCLIKKFEGSGKEIGRLHVKVMSRNTYMDRRKKTRNDINEGKRCRKKGSEGHPLC